MRYPLALFGRELNVFFVGDMASGLVVTPAGQILARGVSLEEAADIAPVVTFTTRDLEEVRR